MYSSAVILLVKRAQDISNRRLVEAGASRDTERLRLRSGLVQEALASLQKALVGLSARDDYDAILTGVAAEVCERHADLHFSSCNSECQP